MQRNSIGISWNPPEDDGGSPLTTYILEKKESTRTYWSNIDRIPASVTSYKIQGLTEDTEYDFRVIAVNRIGASEPLVSDLTTMAKSPYGEL